MENEELEKELSKFSDELTYEECFEKIDKEYTGSELENDLRVTYCSEFLDAIVNDSIEYDLKKSFLKNSDIKLYTDNVKKLPRKEHWFWSSCYFYTGIHDKCLEEIELFLEDHYQADDSNTSEDEQMTESNFVYFFLLPFKNAYFGFWKALAEMLRKRNVDTALIEYAEALHDFYLPTYPKDVLLEHHVTVNIDRAEVMRRLIQQHPDLNSAQEVLGGSLYQNGKYKEAKSYFEATNENSLIYTGTDRYWKLAWIFGKCKDYLSEEYYYKKILENGGSYYYLKNNLAYCLYQQKKYDEAEKLFLDCIGDDEGMPYAANNYVRLLIKCDRAEEARAFVDSGKFKIQKDLCDRLKRLEEKIKSGKKVGKKKAAPEEICTFNLRERRKSIDEARKRYKRFRERFKRLHYITNNEIKDDNSKAAPIDLTENSVQDVGASENAIEVTSNGEVFAKKGQNTRTPYEHQKQAMKCLDIIDREDSFSTLVVLPTGGGKTYTVSLWLLRHAINQNKKILWLAHRQMLLDQAAESFQKYAYAEVIPNVTSFHYRIVSGSVNHDRTIDIASADNLLIAGKDSLGRNLDCLEKWLDGEDEIYLVVDEAHHAIAKTYRKIIDYVKSKVPNTKLIGLTATPLRTAQSEQGLLSRIFTDGVKDGKVFLNDIGFAYQIGLKELIARQILAKPIFESYFTNTSFGDNLGIKDLERISQLDILPDGVAEEMTENAVRNKLIVNTYLAKKEEYGQTIVFAINVTHAISLAALFQQAGVSAAYVVSSVKDSVTGVTVSSEDNNRALEAYRSGSVQVLVNVNILTEGVDLPQTKTVFLARPTVSTIMMTQMVGRALRGQAAGGTEKAYIISFIDKWNEHISWVNPESLFVGEQNDFSDNAEEHQKYMVNMIAISKIEEFASILDKSVDTSLLERVDFTERIPVGMYAFTYMLPKDMEQSYQIMVYDSTKQAYEEMLRALPALFESYGADEEFLSDDLLHQMAVQCEDTFFTGEMIPPYEQNDIVQILKYYAQYEVSPNFYTFSDIDRSKIDVAALAKDVYDRQLSRREEADYINALWNSGDDNMLRLFFGRKNNFLEQFDLEMRKLTHEDIYEGGDNVKYGLREYADMSLYEIRKYNPDYEKSLRESVYALAKDSHGYYKCAGCGKKHKNPVYFQVDHKKALNNGGKTVPENLQLLCRHCNAEKSDHDCD